MKLFIISCCVVASVYCASLALIYGRRERVNRRGKRLHYLLALSKAVK